MSERHTRKLEGGKLGEVLFVGSKLLGQLVHLILQLLCDLWRGLKKLASLSPVEGEKKACAMVLCEEKDEIKKICEKKVNSSISVLGCMKPNLDFQVRSNLKLEILLKFTF